MEFLVIYETNHKENETFIHYCQWTGNENELNKLIQLIEKADYEELWGGDYSSVWVARNKCIPESAVDAHIGLDDPNGYSKMFVKHTGTFKCPKIDESLNEYELARELDQLFYGGRESFSYCFSDC